MLRGFRPLLPVAQGTAGRRPPGLRVPIGCPSRALIGRGAASRGPPLMESAAAERAPLAPPG